MEQFDFDEWANLFNIHPEEFERKRKEVIEREILKAPIERRNSLRMLQLECDVYHQTLSPVAATVAITKIMLEHATELRDELIVLKGKVDELTNQAKNL